MRPKEFVEEMKDSLHTNGVLTPSQCLKSHELIDCGHEFIRKRIEDEYEDMTPEAVAIAGKLQGFLLAFVEHGHNFALLRKMEAS